MPTFFPFQSGSPTRPRAWADSDSTPLLGRFRAVPGPPRRPQNRRRLSQLGLLSGSNSPGASNGSVHVEGGHGHGTFLGDYSSSDGDGEPIFRASGSARKTSRKRRRRGTRWYYDDGDDSEGSEDEELGLGKLSRFGRVLGTWIHDVWVDPTQSAVRKVVGVWYTRWGVLVVLPAALAISWCAIPIPQYPLPDDPNLPPMNSSLTNSMLFSLSDLQTGTPGAPTRHKVPGHGSPRVLLSFPFFLLIYYHFYSLTALTWITKLFNLYSLNWWPNSLGFPVTITLLSILSLLVPVPIYLWDKTRWLVGHNTAWITWTFIVMGMPVMIAFCMMLWQERHLGIWWRRKTGYFHSYAAGAFSGTNKLFSSNWWTGGRSGDGANDPYATPRFSRLNTSSYGILGDPAAESALFDPSDALGVSDRLQPPRRSSRFGFRSSGGLLDGAPVDGFLSFLPASFVRFIWFCLALFIGLIAYVIGEAYAELYLRTMPHNNLETIVYVYSWVATVHLLDALTGWILGGNEGERVGSYPLGWVFKLYFMLTYQTYVRALYARLRSPSQFILLQLISSSFLIILTPILMSHPFHRVLNFLGFNNQSYPAYQKMQARNVFIRGIAENASMLTFVGSVVVLHFGANKDVYPYFAFDYPEQGERGDQYDFNLTFYAANVTWACELAAQLIVRGLIRLIYKVDVGKEGKLDLAVWPELLPTSVVVMLHVLQNMLFSIIRLQFR
ncbi:hypothetical protein MKZ38_009369 [Zalerion maritima]|uniref:Uncharacterized protein n=1 Tax=Zalerion maritima TaxID=339359 RepID=A0AAD5RGA1_9PEZI|nr:hypothetical protein MKZ38_009369 [Zalerion maritima]